MSGRRPRAGAASVALLLLAGVLLPAPRVAAADPAAAARDHLTRERGVAAADLRLVHERPIGPEAAGRAMWAGKFLDPSTGEIHAVYRSSAGEHGSVAILDDAVRGARSALPVLERKGDAPLVEAVATSSPAESLPVAVWLDVDVTAAEAAVVARHPDVAWLAGRPIPTSLAQARQLRGELWEARRAVYAAAADAFATLVEPLGGRIGYASTSAPLVFVDLPAGAASALLERPEVLSAGLEGEWRTSMSSAGPTVSANWTSGSGDQGSGVRVAVVEYDNAANTGDLAGAVVSRYSTTGQIVTSIHPTWVAGAIASSNATWKGTAPGADVITASTGGYSPSLSTDRAIIAAADWSVAPGGGDADVLNASIGQDTATGAEEARRYFDSVVWEDGRLVVASSGNYSTFGSWDVVSPGTGYNVLTVGGIDDRQSAGSGDDRLWYVPGSDGAAYRDRTDASWNQHGDYNKPNLSAPAVNVRTANGTIGSGTSIASPITAGVAAQLLARAPALAAWPEATRALLMAGAVRRTPMPGGGTSTDHEGVGTVSALTSNRILDNGPLGGYQLGSMRPGEVIQRSVPVVAGQRVRAALAWSSHTSGTSNTGKADVLHADLDLIVRQPGGGVVGSYSFDNPYEVVDLVANATGTMTIEVRATRFDAAEEPYGLAWAVTSPFIDIDGSPFHADIMWLLREGITGGCASDRYCPRDPVTREQMASFLVRALDLPLATRDYFTDDETSTHETAINALARAGITAGCDTTRFCPRGLVTRAEMASFLVRALHLPAASQDYFTDDETSMHEPAINALAKAGITGGCTATRYCPSGSVTREQMAAFLHRALK